MRRQRNALDRLRWIFRVANRLESAQLRRLGTSGMALLTRRSILLLETTGRRTGRRRRTPVAYWEDADGDLVIGGGAAGMTQVDWVANLRARPQAWVWIRRRRIPVVARELTGDEYERVREEAFQRWPNAPKYERRSGRTIPYFRLTRSPEEPTVGRAVTPTSGFAGRRAMTPADYYELQLEIECKRILPSGRMGRIPCDEPDDLPLISAVRFLDGRGEWIRAREDASDELDEVVKGLSFEDLLEMSVANGPAPLHLRRSFAGRTGIFARTPDPDEFPLAERDDGAWVIRVDGDVVSWAVSSRGNDRAAELGCETLPEFRRRGYARQVCAAWGNDVLESGRVGFYTYDFDNRASAGLAASLGIVPQFEAGGFELRSQTG